MRRAAALLLDALGVILVVQHVGMAAGLAVVEREGIAGPHGSEPRIGIEFLLGNGIAAAVARPLIIHSAHVAVVLSRPVLPPDGRVDRVFAHFDHALKRHARFALALKMFISSASTITVPAAAMIIARMYPHTPPLRRG
jgi:hypothetical protein